MRTRILVTRPTEQAAELAGLLVERGFEPAVVPTVAIDTSGTAADLDAMLADLAGAAWLILTSANGAAALTARARAIGAAIPPGVRVAAVGPATADALERSGIRVDHVPDEYVTVALADGLGDVRGRRVVLARADAATPELHEALTAQGALVEEVVAYRTVEGPPASRDRLRAELNGNLAGIAFASASAIRGLLRLASTLDRVRARSIPAFCIGPVTAATATRFGFDVAATATEHTALGLADAIADQFI